MLPHIFFFLDNPDAMKHFPGVTCRPRFPGIRTFFINSPTDIMLDLPPEQLNGLVLDDIRGRQEAVISDTFELIHRTRIPIANAHYSDSSPRQSW